MADDTALAQGDLGGGIIVREHRDHGAAGARLSEIGCFERAECDERGGSAGSAVEDGDLMSSPHEIGRHLRAHLAESDESEFHG
jgi:hypothetical protein